MNTYTVVMDGRKVFRRFHIDARNIAHAVRIARTRYILDHKSVPIPFYTLCYLTE